MGNRIKLKKTNDLKLSDDTLDLLLKYDHMPSKNIKKSSLVIDFTKERKQSKKIVSKKRSYESFVQDHLDRESGDSEEE